MKAMSTDRGTRAMESAPRTGVPSLADLAWCRNSPNLSVLRASDHGVLSYVSVVDRHYVVGILSSYPRRGAVRRRSVFAMFLSLGRLISELPRATGSHRRQIWSQPGEHDAQFGAQVATAGPVHRPGTVGQQQA